MRRTFSPSLALLAGLVTLLSGCAGESPTSPSTTPGGGTGSCAVTVTLQRSSATPLAGTFVGIRATVTKNGSPVADGGSVYFTTDYGVFAETGLPTASKVIQNGVADIALGSQYSGIAHVKATYDCGSADTSVNFGSVPESGAFVSSIVPNRGSCTGGDTVTINGGRFTTGGNTLSSTRVTFGGLNATMVSLSDTQIVVKTPARTLANAQVPEQVDVAVVGSSAGSSVTVAKGFTYFCVDKRAFISSITPTSGSPEGGTTVTINGGNFGTNVATTKVTFGNIPASIQSVSDSVITVLTPKYPGAASTLPATVDVAVTRDLGLAAEQTAVLPQAFTYRGQGGGGTCPPTAGLYISAITPNAGSLEGGDSVTITGGGFAGPSGTNTAATTRVDFGGVPAQITSLSAGSITVSTPAQPAPGPVNVVVTIDVGGPSCSSVTSVNGFTYASVPKIYDVSPRTGPNDVSTRVTILGKGFQFPMHVMLTAAGCSSAQIEAQVVSISATSVVILTPIAANGNACLANSLASITVINTDSGNKDTFADAFKYYSCPTVTAATPAYGPWTSSTLVTINGQNFAEPVDAEFIPSGGAAGPARLTVSSFSVSSIVVQMPPADTLQASSGGAACSNLSGTINLTFPSLNCPGPYSVPFVYKVDPPQVTNVGPNSIPQVGGPLITVSGNFFQSPMTVVLTKNGSELPYTITNNATVSNSAQLTFPAPAIRDLDMNQQACAIGTAVTGTKYVPTSFGVKVKNTRTGCTAELPNAITYNPSDSTCRSTPLITGPATLPGMTLCTAYGPQTITASGGTAPYTYSASGLPNGVTINTTTGVIGGTPALSANGAGTATTTLTISVTVTDALAQSSPARTYSVVLTDPGAPFAVSGVPPTASFTTAAGGSTAAPTAAPASFLPITWSMTGAVAGITISPTTGVITVAGGSTVPAATYNLTVTATDTSCGTFHHVASAPLALTVTP